MWRIVRNLYLGDCRDARDRDLLVEIGVTHILNCADEIPCWHRRDFKYLHLRLTDPDPDFHEDIDRLCRFIHRGRKGGAVLVHCAAGLSRSPSAVVAYLRSRGKTVEEALDILQRAVGECDERFIPPDASFLEQVEVHFED